jgi:hypothetical protein
VVKDWISKPSIQGITSLLGGRRVYMNEDQQTPQYTTQGKFKEEK